MTNSRHALRYMVCTALTGFCLFSGVSAHAQETAPGDACAAGEENYIRQVGGPETTGVVHLMRCDGSNWQQYMSILANRNVGIGTTSPGASLDVAGTDSILFPRGTDANRPSVPVNGMMRYNTDNGRFEAYQGGGWADIITSGASNIDWASIVDSMTLDANTNVTMGAFDLSFNNGSSLYIDGSSSYVGIGTTNPLRPLHIAGSLDNNSYIHFTNSTTGTALANGFDIGVSTLGQAIIRMRENSPIGIYTNDVERVSILGNGNVGIGTTSPGATLDVSGTIKFSEAANEFLISDGSVRIAIDENADQTNRVFIISKDSDVTPTGELFRVQENGYVGIGNATPAASLDVAGDIYYTGMIRDVSDRRAKDDIRAIGPALAKLRSIEGVSFVMKGDAKAQRELGVIAQDVQKVYPDLVIETPDGMLGLNYQGLIPPLIEAVKELDAKNIAQDEAIAAMPYEVLRAENARLKEEISEMKVMLHTLTTRMDVIEGKRRPPLTPYNK